ncbi:hypothetical protein [Arthrobacter woluwensis]|uniref:hypothetical protein n=1 Tax=Arthrobacter woluwensis TaxID=156980 RepID=UPI000ADD72C7|nr:hypothetical protein [Arthrobacter woluwensis]
MDDHGRSIGVPGLSGEEGLDYGSRNGGISGAALADGRSFAVVEPGGITTGKQLCADGAGRLYWSDREDAGSPLPAPTVRICRTW